MNENLIPASELCEKYEIEISFLYMLRDTGLINLLKSEDSEYIPRDQLHDLERIARLHYDLEINIEGIETICYLLERISGLQEEVAGLKNRLRRYEDDI